jgi:dihydroneopterin aldolase
MTPPDIIEIRRLEVRTHIGVPDEERAAPQTLWITVRMEPLQGFAGLADEIGRTVDYHAVALGIRALAGARPRRLVETLAVETAEWLLVGHPLAAAAVTIEKRILPETECVAVHIMRRRA